MYSSSDAVAILLDPNSQQAENLSQIMNLPLFQGDLVSAYRSYQERLSTIGQQPDFSDNTTVDSCHPRFLLAYLSQGLSLIDLSQPKTSPLTVDFLQGEHRHRRQFGGGKGQMIAKAVGIQGSFRPHVVDATAGLGGDAFVLACLGCRLTLIERSPIVHALLSDGLHRGAQSISEEARVIQSMDLHFAESKTDLSLYKNSDVVYLDPMFPERKKSAKVKKEMRIFHDLLGVDTDDAELLEQALKVAMYRVVVKRPRLAPSIEGQAPSYQLEGKSCRYDIYTLKKMPTKADVSECRSS